MRPLRLIFSLGALALLLAGCSPPKGPVADEASIRAVSYRDPGPASLTLYTVIRNSTGSGGHSGLLINASQRVIFDPAGSFYLDNVPERNDVLYGITPQVEFYYRSGHARSTYHVLSQTVQVTPEQAELALKLAEQSGPVAGGLCTSATVNLLKQIPGFEQVKPTLFPNKLAEDFAKFPGVVESRYYEDDDSDLEKALAENNAQLAAKKPE